MVQLPTTLSQQAKIGAAVLVAVLLFAGGWWGHSKWAKPVTVTVKVPVYIANPEAPEKKTGNTVEPGHHTVPEAEIPVAPDNPLPTPGSTTVIDVPVPFPQVVRVYHQNSVEVSEQKDGYKIWVNGRVWATDALGATLPGVHATTLFSKEAETFIPVTKTTPKEHPWAIGGIYGMSTRGGNSYGLFVDRDLSLLRLGIEVLSNKTDQGLAQTQVTVKAGFRF